MSGRLWACPHTKTWDREVGEPLKKKIDQQHDSDTYFFCIAIALKTLSHRSKPTPLLPDYSQDFVSVFVILSISIHFQ